MRKGVERLPTLDSRGDGEDDHRSEREKQHH
jgi:hypothetical protein